jgi:hypothetical protein
VSDDEEIVRQFGRHRLLLWMADRLAAMREWNALVPFVSENIFGLM